MISEHDLASVRLYQTVDGYQLALPVRNKNLYFERLKFITRSSECDANL